MMAKGQTRSVKQLASFLLRISGAPYFLRELIQRRRVTILVYHKPSPEVVDRHLTALGRRFNFISLTDYLEFRSHATKRLPAKALIITLDDGHQSNRELKPVFEKHGVRATIFLCSGLVGTNRHFWFETKMSNSMRQGLKRVSDGERLEALSKVGFWEDQEYPERQAMSVGEVEEMSTVVDFQSHTVLHPILPRCSTTRVIDEISNSKADLESRFGRSINALAYPNGDYSDREVAAAENSGYQCALTLDLGFNSRSTPPFQLKRICINDDAGIDELLVKASGLWGFLKALVHTGSGREVSVFSTQPDLGQSQRPGVLDEN